MTDKAKLFIIDPQKDFCLPTGALSVGGADADMSRLAKMINGNLDAISDINVTLDSHNLIHIAHPIWWVDSKGNNPRTDNLGNLALINVEGVENGTWKSYNPGFQDRSLAYVKALRDNGRYILIIWPYHCLIMTEGHNVMPDVVDALTNWEKKFRLVNKVTKGSNIFTEHYSAVKADVIDPEDRTTMLNEKLVKTLQSGNEDILIAGEALSHCVANTIRDVGNEFSDDQIKRFVLLEDACSNVYGFDTLGDDFVNEMTAKGMRISRTDTYFK